MIFKKSYTFFALALLLWWITLADSLADVDISFCNALSGAVAQSGVTVSGNSLSYQIGVEQSWNICYVITNKSPVDATVKVSFVDGTFTNDQWRNKACLSDTDTKYFGKHVTWFENTITISGMQTVQKSANFLYPIGSDGIYHGCLVYSILDKATQNTWAATNFALLMRRAKFVDILVGNHKAASENAIVLVDFNPLSGENLSSNPKIRLYVDPTDGKYVVQFQLKNVSSMDQNLSITGIVSNFLTYNKTFSEPRILLRDETLLVTKKLDDVPSYNLNTKLNISYVPLDTFGDEKPTVGHLTDSANLWIFDTIFVVSVIWLVLFLIIFVLLIKVLQNQSKNAKEKANK